jgi:amidophosphoribosyltransferase
MPNRREFVAHNLTEDEVCDVLGADGLLYQSLEDLLTSGKELNPHILEFEASCFTNKYITGDIDEHYLDELESAGRGKKRTKSGKRQAGPSAVAV